MQVHVDRSGERYGPYSLEDVNAYLANGTLLPTDQAWQDGMPDWVPITQIPGVTMPGGVAAPPPAPAAGSTCPQCQSPVEANQVVCMGCGTQLQGTPAAAKGSKKALFISLGVAGVIGLAVGSYFLFFKGDDTNTDSAKQEEQGKNDNTKGSKPSAPSVPIHKAAEDGDLKAIEQHVAAGTDINLLDGEDGEAPLHRAVTKGKIEAVKLLIESGANVNIGRKKDGDTPLKMAEGMGEMGIVKLLRDKGALGGRRPGGGGGFAGGLPGGKGGRGPGGFGGQGLPGRGPVLGAGGLPAAPGGGLGGFGGGRQPGGQGGGGFNLMGFDKNRDGRVGKTEVPPQMGRLFDRLDSNKDGFIDQAEIKAMRQNFPQGGGKTRPGGFGGGQRPGGQGGGKAPRGGKGGQGGFGGGFPQPR